MTIKAAIKAAIAQGNGGRDKRRACYDSFDTDDRWLLGGRPALTYGRLMALQSGAGRGPSLAVRKVSGEMFREAKC